MHASPCLVYQSEKTLQESNVLREAAAEKSNWRNRKIENGSGFFFVLSVFCMRHLAVGEEGRCLCRIKGKVSTNSQPIFIFFSSSKYIAEKLNNYCKYPQYTWMKINIFGGIVFSISSLPPTRLWLSLISAVEYLRARLKSEESICQLLSLKICDFQSLALQT